MGNQPENSEFQANMEGVLDVYKRPYDADRLFVWMNHQAIIV